MIIEKIALDTNLTLLLAVGRAERGLIARHKRLQRYSDTDYELLVGQLSQAQSLITTPNALTEVSNIARYGIHGASRARVMYSVRALACDCGEVYLPSKEVVMMTEFERLGLADCAWLAMLGQHTTLLTVDNNLYLAALTQGHRAINFDHVRASRGLAQ